MSRVSVLERFRAPAAILCAATLAATGAPRAEAKDGDREKPKAAASAETAKSKDAKAAAEQPKPAEPKPQAGGDGMRAFVDPKTGELREPTEADLAEIAAQGLAAARRAPKVLRPVRHANGMVSVDLTGSEYLDFTVLTVNPDGTLSRRCVKGAKDAEKAAEETAPAAWDWK
jgi:hypothetical protein